MYIQGVSTYQTHYWCTDSLKVVDIEILLNFGIFFRTFQGGF